MKVTIEVDDSEIRSLLSDEKEMGADFSWQLRSYIATKMQVAIEESEEMQASISSSIENTIPKLVEAMKEYFENVLSAELEKKLKDKIATAILPKANLVYRELV